jgi:transcription elongation factor Elf1
MGGFRIMGPAGAQRMLEGLMKNRAKCAVCGAEMVYEKAGRLAIKIGIEHGELVCRNCGSVYRVENNPRGLFLLENVTDKYIDKIVAYAPLGLTRCSCCAGVKANWNTTCAHCGYTEWKRIRTRVIVLAVCTAVFGGSMLLPGEPGPELMIISGLFMAGYFLSVVFKLIRAFGLRQKQAAFQAAKAKAAAASK